MSFKEGIAIRDGEQLNIQCLLQSGPKIEWDLDGYHYHTYIELIYMLKGSVEAYIGDKVYPLHAKDFLVIYGDEPHNFSTTDSYAYLVVKFLPDILYTGSQSINEFEYMFNFSGANAIASRIISDNPKIDFFMKSAFKTFQNREYGGELCLRAYIIQICAEILKCRKLHHEIVSIEDAVSRETVALIRKIADHVKNTNGCVKTHEAAKICNMSDGHFSRIFRAVMKMPFTAYAKTFKIAEAERLLKCTDETITSIAQLLNYAAASHFIEDFRRAKGVSPKQYRKNFQQNRETFF